MRTFFNMVGFPTVIVLGADGVELDRQLGFGGDGAEFVATMKDWSENKNTLLSHLGTWAKDTTDIEWNYRIAMRYTERFQPELAERFWQNVVKLDQGDVAGYRKVADFNLALNGARSGQPENLALLLENETDRERLQAGYRTLARLYEGQNDVDNAIRVYRRALEKMPDNASLMNGGAWFVYEQQAKEHYAWAIDLAQKAVELEPDEASIWDTLAWLLYADGQHQQAMDAMKKAAEIDPGFKPVVQKMKNDMQQKNL
ncbi:tetratricopeptide repeat protein [candidate division KSB1 bacterium]|nr:tetratricopeptide repeat protein [candidate division KSB1 bacterium]